MKHARRVLQPAKLERTQELLGIRSTIRGTMIRVQIASDDGHSCTLLTNSTATVSKICDDYCKLRRLGGPLSLIVQPSECILAYEPAVAKNGSNDLQYLNSEVKVNTVLGKKVTPESDGIAAKFKIFGFVAKKHAVSYEQVHSIAGQFSALSSEFLKAMNALDGNRHAVSSLENVARRVEERVKLMEDDVMSTLNLITNASVQAAAKGTLDTLRIIMLCTLFTFVCLFLFHRGFD